VTRTPSPIITRGNTELPSPAGGRGHCNEHRACAHISRCQTAHLVPTAHVCARALQLCFAHPNRGVGGAPRDVWVLGGTPVGHAVTWHARRLRGALRPMTRDARLSALHRGGFGLPGPRFRLRHCLRIRAASSSHPGRSAWRAGSLPPGANGYEPPPQDATPRSAFRIVSRTRPQ
jgi:hypothetical protein